MRRALAAAAIAVLTLSGCSSADQQAPPSEKAAPSGSSSASGAQSVVDVRIKGDQVEPNGKRVKVGVGEPVTLHVEADREAELHVHSSPEQELEVKKGVSTLSFTVKTPGIVEVEEHESGIVVLQLEVS